MRFLSWFSEPSTATDSTRRVAQLLEVGRGEVGPREMHRVLDLGRHRHPLIAVRHGVEIGECSVTTAFALYGAPFFRTYPGRRFVVTTLRLPVRLPGPARPPTRPRTDPASWLTRGGRGTETKQARLRARIRVDAQRVRVFPGDVQAPRDSHALAAP